MTLRNTYVVCLGDGYGPVAWIPPDPQPHFHPDCRYFGRVLAAFDKASPFRDLTVYLTWDTETLPSQGDNVVAVLLGDEHFVVPRYANDVRMLFKTYGTKPYLGTFHSLGLDRLSMLTALQYARAWVRHMPEKARAAQTARRRKTAPLQYRVLPIPLGYYRQDDLPLQGNTERRYDVAFNGSIVSGAEEAVSRWSPRYWKGSPKSVSRQRMLRELEDFAASRPDLDVLLATTPGFHSSESQDRHSYSEIMASTRIAVCPRGTTFESSRIFEAARAGCVIVTERLPPRWFYDAGPFVTIGGWEDLPATLHMLLQDESSLEARQKATRNWWETVVSEEIVGMRMAIALASTLP